jgi:hypothetical protein
MSAKERRFKCILRRGISLFAKNNAKQEPPKVRDLAVQDVFLLMQSRGFRPIRPVRMVRSISFETGIISLVVSMLGVADEC